SAVRNGPTRFAEMNTDMIAIGVATLMPASAAQPTPVCGGCQVCVAIDMTTNTTVDDTSEYQVISRASDVASSARVISSMAARLTAAAKANSTPAIAIPPGCAPTISARPAKATIAAAAPRQPSVSRPVRPATSPVISG